MIYSWFIILNGALYVLIALFSIPLHILVAFSVIKTGTVRKRITLRILLSLAFADILQLIFHGISGLYIICGATINDTWNDVMGFAMNGLWTVTLLQHVALALNRMKVVTSKTVVREEEFKYFDTWIVAAWFLGFLKPCSYCINGYYNLYFDPLTLNWANRGGGISTIFVRIWFYFRLAVLIAGILASVFVIASLIINRRTLATNSRLITARDLRLFIQTSAVFILAITHVGTWNLAPSPGLYLLSILNMEWVMVCALLPYLNLAMSSDIRNSLLRVLHIANKTSSISAGPVTVFNVSTYKQSYTKGSG